MRKTDHVSPVHPADPPPTPPPSPVCRTTAAPSPPPPVARRCLASSFFRKYAEPGWLPSSTTVIPAFSSIPCQYRGPTLRACISIGPYTTFSQPSARITTSRNSPPASKNGDKKWGQNGDSQHLPIFVRRAYARRLYTTPRTAHARAASSNGRFSSRIPSRRITSPRSASTCRRSRPRTYAPAGPWPSRNASQ